ncbi:MAG: NTP transferase domain-containing protein, partial [Planctomycetota bacterium]
LLEASRERPSNALLGLLASLRRARSLNLDGVLALACDMPFVEPEDLDPLLSGLRGGADVARWIVPDASAEPGSAPRPQPLVAAYRCTVEDAAEQALARGARRLVAIDEESAAGGRRLRIEGIVAQENSVFRLVNVNTPTDYDAARTAAGASSSTAHRSSPRT